MKLRRMFIAAAASLMLTMPAVSAVFPAADLGGWEAAPRRPLAEGAVYGVATSGEWVYVTSAGEVKASLLTVLGQRVTEVNLPAGTHRFRLAARGIYILRLGSSTYRITL